MEDQLASAMNLSLSRKLWLGMVAGALLVVVQYQIANSWLLALNSPPMVMQEPSLQAAVDQMQFDSRLVATVGERLLHDIARQVSLRLSSEMCRNSVAPISSAPTLYVVTPTYRRPEQIPELTRLAQTLMHVSNLHWLVIEDSVKRTLQVTQLLQRTGLSFNHLVAPMPDSFKNKKGSKPRGVSNRNRGIQWLRANATTGVFYFADDDNTYDISLFEEMRDTKRVSMWPVGLCTKFGLSSPVVSNGTLVGFYDGWIAGRKFPVDMAGFAVSVEFLHQRPKAAMPYKPGFEEDGFLRSLAPLEAKDVELKADYCTKILVWHTQTKKNEHATKLDMKKYKNTNLIQLMSLIV